MAAAVLPSGSKSADGRWQPPSAEELQKLLPQYEVTTLLGRGGMGAVYRGRQMSLDRPVAIKIISNDLDAADASYGERFKNEARAMAKLNHPGIVAVFDYGQTSNGILYIVMECVEGTDVARMIAKQKRLHTDHAMAITAHVCDALAYAHERGIIHRDIKPANIMVSYEGVVKVADFGLAKMTRSGDAGLTQSGMAMGTLHYMAPEALMLGTAVDHRADIYAVGVMLYQMLTGKVPHGIFELPSVQVPGLDPRYDAVIAQAMREDRDNRYQSIRDLRGSLDNILTQPVVKVESSAKEVPAALNTQARPKRPRADAAPAEEPEDVGEMRAQVPSSAMAWVFGIAALVLGTGWYWQTMHQSSLRNHAVSDLNTSAATPSEVPQVKSQAVPMSQTPDVKAATAASEPVAKTSSPSAAAAKPSDLPWITPGAAALFPHAELIQGITWEGAAVQFRYQGELPVTEKKLGELKKFVRGLAFHPDGRVAFLDAVGASPEMGLSFWDSSGSFSPIVPLTFTRSSAADPAAREDDESRGIFSSFGGSVAFDRSGNSFFTQGGVIRQVLSSSPVKIAKWSPVKSGMLSGLQIPGFDDDHFYIAKDTHIFRIAEAQSAGWGAGDFPAWFTLFSGGNASIHHVLVLSPSRLIVHLRISSREVHGGSKTTQFIDRTLLLDRDAKACWSLAPDLFGPMAMSWDGKRLIRFDWATRSLMEFSLGAGGDVRAGTSAPLSAPTVILPEQWIDAMPGIWADKTMSKGLVQEADGKSARVIVSSALLFPPAVTSLLSAQAVRATVRLNSSSWGVRLRQERSVPGDDDRAYDLRLTRSIDGLRFAFCLVHKSYSQTALYPLPAAFDWNAPHTLEFWAVGNTMTLFLDGRKVDERTDNRLSSGFPAMFADRGAVIERFEYADFVPPVSAGDIPPVSAVPELAMLAGQYEQFLNARVTAVFDAELALLNTSYIRGIDREIAKERAAGRAGPLDALEAEKKLITEQRPVPAKDDAGTSAAVKHLRAIYRIEHAKIDVSRMANLKKLTNPLLATLASLEAELAQKGRSADAAAVRQYREKLAATVQ